MRSLLNPFFSPNSSGEDDKENKDDEVEEIANEANKLPMPNFSMPNFPPNFAAAAAASGMPTGLPNFDASNLPQGVRELAMLQHQQMAQVRRYDDERIFYTLDQIKVRFNWTIKTAWSNDDT